jgi:hypothetical protein
MGRNRPVAPERPALTQAINATERLKPQSAPRWMTWAPLAAITWAIVYGSVQTWWAIGGAPSFAPFGSDLIALSGWRAVCLCAAIVGVTMTLRRARWSWPLLGAAWGVSVALLAASALLLLDVVGGLLPGLGVEFHPVAFLSRGAGFSGAVLLGANAVAYRRRWRSACLFCGRTRTSERLARPPRWAWWAAYAAVAGCLIRLLAQLAVGFGTSLLNGAGSVVMFEAGFLLVGTVLPLALIRSWGRVVPRWVPLLAGHRVPRWLLLGPAFAIGGMMTGYFGVTLVWLGAETLTGTWDQGDGSLPLAFFWIAVPAYLTWGLGLVGAALGYYRVTRPRCRECGQ